MSTEEKQDCGPLALKSNLVLGPLVEAAGMVNVLNHGSGSCVYSEGCHGVTQEHLERFAEMVRADERKWCDRAMRDALEVAVRQNEHDMLMTGEELRACRAALDALGPNKREGVSMRTCEDGCNGCDDCTDYDDEGVSMENTGFGCDLAKDTSRIFELEQRCAALEEQANLDAIRMGRLAESNQKLKDMNREMFVSRCQAHMRTERLEDFLQRMLEAATPQIGHAWKEEIRQVLVEDVPDSKTPNAELTGAPLGAP